MTHPVGSLKVVLSRACHPTSNTLYNQGDEILRRGSAHSGPRINRTGHTAKQKMMVSEGQSGQSLNLWFVVKHDIHKRGEILLYAVPRRLTIRPRMIKLAATKNVGAREVVMILKKNQPNMSTRKHTPSDSRHGLTV